MLSDISIKQFWLIKILPIIDAILSLKPFVRCFFACLLFLSTYGNFISIYHDYFTCLCEFLMTKLCKIFISNIVTFATS